MKNAWRWLGVLAFAAATQGGWAGLAMAQGTPAASPPASAAAASEGYQGGNLEESLETSPTETEPGTELPVLYITGIEIIRSQTSPPIDIVRVTGLTGSQGWTSPQLVPTYIGKPLDGILDLQFIATMPLQTEPATGFFQVSALFPLGEGNAFRGVRVRGSENAIELDQIPGVRTVQIGVNDCRDCVGKKFAERGQAPPGSPGVVRQEDLPKILRWIPPNHGIRGITHNPNRLNLLLGGDNTIIAAYWE
ncbi:MAG: hypothetical protein WB611_11345 [Stellaceae bacterium]